MFLFSTNCAGCCNKFQSLVDNVNHIGAGIFTLQETHFKRKCRLNNKFSEFQIFEAICKKQKGGTVIGVYKSLEEFELLTVEVQIGGQDVRIMSGCGPLENWKLEERK